jgi:hypothetical protein
MLEPAQLPIPQQPQQERGAPPLCQRMSCSLPVTKRMIQKWMSFLRPRPLRVRVTLPAHLHDTTSTHTNMDPSRQVLAVFVSAFVAGNLFNYLIGNAFERAPETVSALFCRLHSHAS